MVITFSNIKGSAGGGGATGGTVSGITLWSDETTKAYIDDALSGVTDVLSAYTKTEDFATINGSAITSGGNLVIEATPYTAGTNIDITDHIISVTGISVPTKVSELVNDSGYITTADTQNFVTSGDVQTQINDSISGKADSSAVTAQINEVKAEIEAEIPSKVSDLQNDLNFASTGDVESMISGFTTSADVKTQIEGYNYINSGQAQTQIDNSISGKVDNSALTQYYTSEQTDTAISNAVSGKMDTSAMSAYSTTEEVENMISAATDGLASEEWVNSKGFLTEHQSLSAYSTTEQMNQAIGSATAATTGWVESQGYLTEHQSLSAYTPTSGMATINGSAITEGGNIVVEETPYSGGANIDITDHIISVTGITIPTKVSELVNDAGYVTSGEVETQITDKGYITGYTETDPVFMASPASGISAQDITNWNSKLDASSLEPYYTSAETDTAINNAVSGKADLSAVTAQIGEVKAEIEAKIPSKVSDLQNDLNFVNSADVKTQVEGYNYINYGQAQTQIDNSISGKLDTDKFTTYTASTQIELNNKQDISGMTEYATTAFTESTYLKEHQSLSAYTPTSGFSTINGSAITSGDNLVIEEIPYSGGANIDITDHIISVTGITIPTSNTAFTNDAGYVTSGEVETQITDKGYITGYTESDPVFQASAASGITSQDISNWNNKLDSSALTPYYTSAQTDTAISNAISGKMDTSAMSAYTKTEGFATINGSAITEGGNIEIQGGSSIENYQPLQVEFDPSYSFIDAYEINSVGKQQFYKRIAFDTINGNSIIHQSDNDKVNWTIPTSTSALTNDSGYVTSGEVNTQIESKGYITDTALNGYATTAFTEQTYLKEHQSLSAYTPTSGFSTINGRSITEGGNIVIQGGGSGSDYIAGANIEITADNVINVTGITVPTKVSELTNDEGFVNYGEVETQITDKGYITGYTETDPVFMSSPASGITEQNIIDWDAKLDSSDLEPYYTSAETDTAISNATSGKQDTLVSGVNIKTINNESLLGSGNIVIQGSSGSGSNIIELTQAEYDALTAYTEDAIYVITDAQAINMDNYVTTGALDSYYTSAETDTAIYNAVSGKTDKVSVTASSSGYKFPTWNNQGCITGTYSNAYQASQSINGSTRYLYSTSSSSLPTIYAPASAGSAGQPLLSNGSGAPVWGAYKFQFISQSQYDALATKDSTTIYFIVNEN